MRVLLSAFSCCPSKASEPGNAWRLINNLLPDHEVWAVIEREHDYERRTQRFLAEHPMPGFHPVFVEASAPLGWMFRGRGVLEAVYYHLWQLQLPRVVRRLHEQVRFEVCHHMTYGRYWSPSGVNQLGIPFIWGPVGAAETPPASFVEELGFRERVFEWGRDKARALSVRVPSMRRTIAAATIGIGVTRESCQALRQLGVRRVEQLPQMAFLEEDLEQFDKYPAPPPGPFRAVCIGRMLHWKGFHLAIRAFAQFARQAPEAELWLINNGPYRPALERVAAESGVARQIRFLGHLESYDEVMNRLAQCHVLMHPALHEGFGNACLEALAAGRPVVCLDIGGPASQVSPETGFAAPTANPARAVQAMAEFLARLNRDRALLARMSAAARQRVREHFTMRSYGQAIRSFYREAVELQPR